MDENQWSTWECQLRWAGRSRRGLVGPTRVSGTNATFTWPARCQNDSVSDIPPRLGKPVQIIAAKRAATLSHWSHQKSCWKQILTESWLSLHRFSSGFHYNITLRCHSNSLFFQLTYHMGFSIAHSQWIVFSEDRELCRVVGAVDLISFCFTNQRFRSVKGTTKLRKCQMSSLGLMMKTDWSLRFARTQNSSKDWNVFRKIHTQVSHYRNDPQLL